MVLIGPESVVIGSDRSVRVEKAKCERAKYKVAREPGRDGGPWGLELPLLETSLSSRFVPRTTSRGRGVSSKSKTNWKVSGELARKLRYWRRSRTGGKAG